MVRAVVEGGVRVAVWGVGQFQPAAAPALSSLKNCGATKCARKAEARMETSTKTLGDSVSSTTP